MPQEIRVLQCFQCKIFQVDIVKKSTKWKCRVCNIKQTFRKEYFRSSGAECRIKVQELNLSKGQKQNETVLNFLDLLNADESEFLEDTKDETAEITCVNVNNYIEKSSEVTSINSSKMKIEQEQNEFNKNGNKNSLEIGNVQQFEFKRDTCKKSKWAKFEEDQNEISSVLDVLNDGKNNFFENFNNDTKKIIDNTTDEKEHPTLFNFSQTKKWSSLKKSMQKDDNEITKISNQPKKSKWDNYL